MRPRRLEERAKSISRAVIGFGFALAGAMHFVKPALYARFVPPQFGHPLLLVYISGVGEVLGAIGIFSPKLRRAAGYGLTVLLLAVYPANIYMALHPESFGDVASPAALWARLPLQFILVGWVWWCCSL